MRPGALLLFVLGTLVPALSSGNAATPPSGAVSVERENQREDFMPREVRFEVVAFNVENLFDLDETSSFDDYRTGPGDYSASHLRHKLEMVSATLADVDGGRGPAVILFQEFERDFSPQAGGEDPEALLDRYAGVDFRTLLARADGPAGREIRDLPSSFWVLKALEDSGLGPYNVALGLHPETPDDKPHTNAVFSRFPILSNETFETEDARPIQHVVIDVLGHPFHLVNNHWKSGASRIDTELIRHTNARDTLRVVEAILEENPFADVLVGGDLNSYYNQDLLLDEMGGGDSRVTISAVNDILGSQGDEAAMFSPDGPLFYNLWFELPPEERYTEVWRGMKGTLMQMLVTRGLFDEHGVGYVDNSFRTIRVEGVNVDPLGKPVPFSFAFGGSGASDHLPILARFEVVPGQGESEPGVFLSRPTNGREDTASTEVLLFSYDLDKVDGTIPSVWSLPQDRNDPAWRENMRELFALEGVLVVDGLDGGIGARFGERLINLWTPLRPLSQALEALPDGTPLSLVGQLSMYDGEYQLVIEDPNWVKEPKIDVDE